MAKLFYVTNLSLDGYTEDVNGKFDWTEPDEEQFRFITDLIRPAGTHLYGRRMYETMMVWETDPSLGAGSPFEGDFAAVWQSANKIVYSRTLQTVSTRKTELARDFDPAALRQLKESVEHDILIGGPELAAHAFRVGLVDECHLFIAPVILGSGKPFVPGNVRLELELLDERRFGNGVVFVRYRTL